MRGSPLHITLEVQPRERFDVIDVAQRVLSTCGDVFHRYKKSFYCSYHTTAGYLEQSLCAKLRYSQDRVSPFIASFQHLFPPGANYRHDQLQLRQELSDEERQCEPRNADSHLIFISSGMKNCVTYENRPGMPVYFIDLDGVNGTQCRRRQTAVLAYDREEAVHDLDMPVPMSRHLVDSINLNDGRLELFKQLQELVDRYDVQHGRIDIHLAEDEKHAGLTVNEYETLLMKHDLAEVLRNPFKFMALKGKHALAEPQLIPGKTLDYAKYDLVHLFNQVMDKLGFSDTVVENVLSSFIRATASHFLAMKRHISLLVASPNGDGPGRIVFGRYQSPILVQWQPAEKQTRHLRVTITRFE